MTVEPNEFGQIRIALDGNNTTGAITIDGDIYETGPVAIIDFELSSDRIGADGEIDFGTFRITMPHGAGAGVRGCVILNEQQTRELIDALTYQIRPIEAST